VLAWPACRGRARVSPKFGVGRGPAGCSAGGYHDGLVGTTATLDNAGAPRPPNRVAAASRPGISARGTGPGAGARREGAARLVEAVAGGRLVSATPCLEGVTRLGQDRSLFRGGGGGGGGRGRQTLSPDGPENRAHGAVSSTGSRGAVSGVRAGRMAFRASNARKRAPHLAGGWRPGEALVVAGGALRRWSWPFARLGLVVVDEEHEEPPTSRRTASPITARDMAVVAGADRRRHGQSCLASGDCPLDREPPSKRPAGAIWATSGWKPRYGGRTHCPTLRAIDLRKGKPAPGAGKWDFRRRLLPPEVFRPSLGARANRPLALSQQTVAAMRPPDPGAGPAGHRFPVSELHGPGLGSSTGSGRAASSAIIAAISSGGPGRLHRNARRSISLHSRLRARASSGLADEGGRALPRRAGTADGCPRNFPGGTERLRRRESRRWARGDFSNIVIGTQLVAQGAQFSLPCRWSGSSTRTSVSPAGDPLAAEAPPSRWPASR